MLVAVHRAVRFISTRWVVALATGFALTSCVGVSTLPATVETPTPSDDAVITLHYNERPPYLITTGDGVGGLTGEPTTRVFTASGIAYRWEQTPSKRQIYLLQQNAGQDCLVGWFKNTEREGFAQYTLPVYRDEPQVALARADNDTISSGHAVVEAFSDPNLVLLVKDGYSYGDYLDRQIRDLNPVRTITTIENSGMLRMIAAGHADYFFIAPEEVDGLLASSEFDGHDFKAVHFTDIVSGEERYILCSRQVDPAIIERLNRSIELYVVLPTEEAPRVAQ